MFVLMLPLDTTEYDRMILEKRFGMVKTIHNACVNYAVKKMRALLRNTEYRAARKRYGELHDLAAARNKAAIAERKALSARMTEIRADIGLTYSAMIKFVAGIQHKFKKHITSHQAQAEMETVWAGVEKVLFGNGKSLHFKKWNDITTVHGKSSTGVKFVLNLQPVANRRSIDCHIEWIKFSIPVRLDISKQDLPDGGNYAWEALGHVISYCEIKRLEFKSGYRYYVKLVLRGDAPKRKTIGHGTAGMDEGTSTIAVAADHDLILEELAPDTINYERQISKLQKQVDRSKRLMNPGNYNPDGTVKRGRHKWKLSRTCLEKLWLMRVLYRKRAEYIKGAHANIANRIISIADTVINEPMRFRSLAKRARGKAERSDKASVIRRRNGTEVTVHKFKRKKRFGHSVSSRAPALLIILLKQKIQQYGGTYLETDPFSYRASQYDHTDGLYKKVPLSCRMKQVGGFTVQRDLYSAYLTKNADAALSSPDRESCIAGFGSFMKMHDALITQMQLDGLSRPYCFGF